MTPYQYLQQTHPHETWFHADELEAVMKGYALTYANEQNASLYGIIESQKLTADAMGKRLLKYEAALKFLAGTGEPLAKKALELP